MSAQTLTVASVAFDDFAFRHVATRRGNVVERGENAAGVVLGVSAVAWPGLPTGWVSFQSRRLHNHLNIFEEMDPVGHKTFDEAFAVDADDSSTVRRLFRTSLRDWLVDFDALHGPLIIVFDGDDDAQGDDVHVPDVFDATDLVEVVGEEVANRLGAHIEAVDVSTSTVFVAREVADDDELAKTVDVASELVAHIRSAIEG